MKVKKCLLVAVISLLTTFFCIVPFSSVKALTVTPNFTTSYGNYTAETFTTSSGDNFTLGWGPLSTTITIDSGSVFHFNYQFDAEMTGSITIQITTTRSFALQDCTYSVTGGWFVSHTGNTVSGTSHTFKIGLDNSTGFDLLVAYSPDTYTTKVFNDNITFTLTYNLTETPSNNDLLQDIYDTVGNYFDYKLSDMADTLSNILTATEDVSDTLEQVYINEKYMPFRNLSAYVWGLSYGSYSPMTPFEFPAIYYDFSNNNSSYDISKRITINANTEVCIYYLTTTYIANSYISLYLWREDSNITKLNRQIANYNVVNSTYLYLNKLTVSGATALNYFEIEFDRSFYICPLYIGNPDNIPDDLALVAGEDYNNTYTRLLTQILQAVGGDIQLDQNNADDYNNGLNDIGNFLNTVRNVLPTTTSLNNDIGDLPNFVNQFTGVSNFVQSVYVDLTTTVPEFKWLIIVGLLAIVMRIIAL